MINNTNPTEKRKQFREALDSGKLLQFPGAYNPMVAMLVQQLGFHGVYVSGGVMANTLGLPDIGLTTLPEVTKMASDIAKVTSLPTIMDIDTGFGEIMNAYRTIKEIEYAGLSGCHMEDQILIKRCGHLDNKTLISAEDMARKIRAASDAKTDENFILIARTDAAGVNGMDDAIDRAKRYIDAGADMIFPEAMRTEKDFETFRKAVDVPLLANMTEFGKSKLLNKTQLENLGMNLVIYPVTTQRLAMGAVEKGLNIIKEEGSQESALELMQTRSRLYEVVKYEDYNNLDQSIFNFELSKEQ